MDRGDYVRTLRSDGDILLAAAKGAMDRPVPCCPGWVGRDVVAHTGFVHRLMADRVRRGVMNGEDALRSTAPDGDAILDWYREGLVDLIEVLESADPDKPVWNWSSTAPHTAAFWPRRMAHETAVHRVDAEIAAGAARPIDAALAADGVDEFLTVFFAEDAAALTGGGETVLLRTDDAPREWTVTAGAAGAAVAAGPPTEAATTLRGGASDLVLALWRRLPIDAIDVSGDRDLAARFLATADLD